MHIGYPRPWTLGEQLEGGWLDARRAHWMRICEIVVDGRLLRDTAPVMRKPSPHEQRFSKKFGEVMIAAHALARLSRQPISMVTREGPDLEVTVGARTFGIEIGEINPNAHASGAIIELNIQLRDLVDSQPELQPQRTYVNVIPKPCRESNKALSVTERRQLLGATVYWLRSGSYREFAGKTRMIQCLNWPGEELGYLLQIAPAPHLEEGSVVIYDGATVHDSEAMIQPALRMLERKRLAALSYDRSHPLWLILGLTPNTGLYTASMDRLAEQTVNTGPYERVILHDGRTYLSTQTDVA